MAHGLEMRAPMLDHIFYQSILSLSENDRFSNPAKSILATHATEVKPILKRKKRGFNPPLTTWLNQDLASRLNGLDERLDKYTSGQINKMACSSMPPVLG